MSRGTRALIDTGALRANLARVREWAPNSRVWAVVKADGYGHGAVNVARALTDADGFAVATLAEAQCLRDAGIEQPILLLEGTIDLEQARQALELRCDTVVHQAEQLAHLEQLLVSPGRAASRRLTEAQPQPTSNTTGLTDPGTRTPRLWLKVDTGMHRLGVAPDEVPTYLERLRALSPAHPVGLMTHFASADEADPTPTEQQLGAFDRCEPGHAPACLANSAGVMAWPRSHRDWVRPGIMLYGASPGFNKTGLELGLKPAMTLTAPVIAVREIPAGDRVGYGGRWQARRPSRIATLAIGYGDGYPRHAPDGTPVWLRGRKVPLVGKVSMDMLTVDVTDLDRIEIGEDAELWGTHLSVDEVAAHIGTVGYELLTRVSPRVEKRLL